jgi:DNA sulfur modification protein DndD
MWISEVRINNFRPFYGEQTINFKEYSNENFTVIEAMSDTGKTTFLSALCWCLYGHDLGKYREENSHPFNWERKDELEDEESDYLEVEITLNDDADLKPRYIIDRRVLCTKYGNDINDEEDSLKIIEWEGNKANSIDDPDFCDKIINSILPEDIHMFFLFEGEKLDKTFSFYEPDDIQAAIEKVSQIQLVKSAIQHIEKSMDRVYDGNRDGKGNVDIGKNMKAIERMNDEIETHMAKKEIYIKNLKVADSKIEEIDDFLRKVNIPLIGEWVEKRKKLEEENNEFGDKIESVQEKVTESLLKDAPLAICSSTLNHLIENIEATSQKNELPPKIKNVYVRELLEKKICICGRSLDPNENKDAKEAVESLIKILNQNDLSDLAEKLIEGRYALRDILKILPDTIIKERNSKLTEVDDLTQQVKKNELVIGKLNVKLEESDEETITMKNSERIGLISSRDPQIRSITRIDDEIESTKNKILIERRELEQLAKKQDNYKTMKKIADFMDRAYDHLEVINDDILEEVRTKVKNKTFDSFINLHWDKDNYSNFEIDENYCMSLKDSNENERIYDIAGGPKQILLLSFISALAEVSGFKFPIFIDTPLANTDNSQRENIAKNLPNYLKGNQVVLLVKDQEYTSKFRSIIKDNICQEYRFVKTGGRTEVGQWA